MANIADKTPDSPEDQIRQLQKENNRLQRIIKRHETQLQHLDKMASANEKTNIALYKELEVLQQQAEAQAREAQIEAALERVRARTMGMHKSEELAEVVKLLYKETEPFGVSTFGISIAIFREEENAVEYWFADNLDSKLLQSYKVAGQKNKVFRQIWEDWKNKTPQRKVYMEGNEKWDYDTFILEETEFSKLPEDLKQDIRTHKTVCFTFTFFKYGYFESVDLTIPNEENAKIIIRFAKVFEQTYTRFLDLQKAEAQAREAQIEAALERVRARAMAMHHSDDLDKVNKEILNQLHWLQVPGLTGVTFYLTDEHGWVKAWDFSSPGNIGNPNSYTLQYDFNKYEMMGEPFRTFRQTDLNYYVADYPLEKLEQAVYELMEINPAVANIFKEALAKGILTHQWSACARISDGLLGIDLVSPPSEDTKTIVLKIAGAFNQAYQRFLDLQRAEAQARQALQQASLERVRAEIASMRTAGDLNRITPLIWRELTTLGVPFFRCGVFIIEEATDPAVAGAHVYLSTPAGEAVAALHLKFDSAPVVKAAVQHWRRQQVYREEWNREQFIAWTQSILKQGLIDSSEKYQAGGEAPEKLVLQFVPFTQGMLYVGSSAVLSEDEIAIGQALANAFGVAYARYEDFQRLEAAKTQVEAALDNLKKTQGQLVQAEKMASLGQLTAGIAHEIKNPLNFVNNFAALSMDLAKELREELIKRKTKNANGDDFADVDELLDMLEQNAEKINHHGKRADGIVHAMMQHARGGKGERQPTDVNRLVEEYVNLSYHGMRAKIPDFNVTIEQDFGELDGKIEMVPQDIGRVLLNLLSNAFDAVRERAQSGDGEYSASVTVSTRTVEGAVEIRVRDNGGGIPEEVREKIFEPFFTTKPTGSGTGLGLSLSFDIVTQGHGGTLTVENSKGEGATFVVTLPVN
ncbi:hypothetical protein KJ068_16975 [bacterium]|nr:hypothetical protein [bacterium]